MAKNVTANEGAALERQAWMAKLKRMWSDSSLVSATLALSSLLDFGERRTARNAAKPGGLGRKRKVAK